MIDLIIGLSLSFLAFLIFYGLLNKVKIFERSVNLVVSMVASLFVLFAFEYYESILLKTFSFFSLLILIIFTILSLYLIKDKLK